MSVSRVFLFGTQSRLCGIHHVPARSGARGLLICPPLLHESSRTHWALRQMAVGCANRGIDVVQFDFTGCGNSPGPLPREKVTDWQDDIAAALAELRNRIGQHAPIAIIAVRFAAALVPALQHRFTECCLWDPVLAGQDWLDDLKRIRQIQAQEMPYAEFNPTEFGGQVLGTELLGQIKQFKTAVHQIEATRSLILLGSNERRGGDTERWATQVDSIGEEYTWLEKYLPLVRTPSAVTKVVEWIEPSTTPPASN